MDFLPSDPGVAKLVDLIHRRATLTAKLTYASGYYITKGPEGFRVYDPKGRLLGQTTTLESAEYVLAEVLS